MGLKLDELDETGVGAQLVPGSKYIKLELEEEPLQEIELELFSQADLKQNNKYQKLETDEITTEEDNGEEGINTILENSNTANLSFIKLWKQKIQTTIENNQVKFGWACTISGILCTGWIGPCFKLLGSYGVGPARRASWRSQALLILLLFPALFEYRSLTPQQKRDIFNRRTLLQLLLCGILWFFDLFLWSNALEVSRSSVFANTTSLMIMAWSVIRRQPISPLEIAGGLVGFCGIVFAVVGTNLFFASEAESNASNPLLGDILSVGSAASVAAYVINATKARAKVSLFIYTLSNTLILFVALSSASFIMEGTKIDFSVDGIFGWVDPQFLLIVGLLSVVAGLIGFNLNNTALRYMPPIGYSLVGLCDPFISGTYAWIIKADGLPGIFTLLGGVITISGIVILVVGQEKRKKKEKEAKAQEEPTKVVEFVVSDGTDV